MSVRFLVVDGEKSIVTLLRLVFADEAHVTLVPDAKEGLRRIVMDQPNVVIFHMCQAGTHGLAFLREAKVIDPTLSIILTSEYGKISEAIQAMQIGAFDYIGRPVERTSFSIAMHKAVETNIMNRRLRSNGTRTKEPGGDVDVMIGSSPRLLEIWKLVGRIADTNTTVLIQGESGTGKELLARSIHAHSQRRHRPFLVVNCAAMPDTLFEAELFGHEKGAFTDAYARRIGKFENCNGGTILLDEIGEMSLVSQAKLLRVLENQSFERVGGNQSIRCDVRTIACTHQDLEQAVRQKRFRLDLYHRLKVVCMHLPPLRERPEDIPELIDLFCGVFSRAYHKEPREVSQRAKRLLMAHRWEGNIREMKNVINSAVAASAGPLLDKEDFERILGGTDAIVCDIPGGEDYYQYFVNKFWPSLNAAGVNTRAKYVEISQGLEKSFIQFVLENCKYNQVQASKILGLSRGTLRNRISHHQISRSSETDS